MRLLPSPLLLSFLATVHYGLAQSGTNNYPVSTIALSLIVSLVLIFLIILCVCLCVHYVSIARKRRSKNAIVYVRDGKSNSELIQTQYPHQYDPNTQPEERDRVIIFQYTVPYTGTPPPQCYTQYP